MSLDVYLEGAVSNSAGTGIFVRESGEMRELTRAEWDEKFPDREPVVSLAEPERCYWANITHNLNTMADMAGIYQALWRPEEIGVTTAAQLIPLLRDGLTKLRAEPEKFKAFNPKNGWGDYDGLVRFVAGYLEACEVNPTATVRASR